MSKYYLTAINALIVATTNNFVCARERNCFGFSLAGSVGLGVTMLSRGSNSYKLLGERYEN